MNTIVKYGYRPMFPSFFDEVIERAANDAKDFYYKPAANIHEDDAGFNIEIALPGFEKEEISMKLEKNILTISAGHDKKESEKENTYSWHEFGKTGMYRRAFIIPETINTEEIVAEYRNGVLKVVLPKKDVKPIITKEITIA